MVTVGSSLTHRDFQNGTSFQGLSSYIQYPNFSALSASTLRLSLLLGFWTVELTPPALAVGKASAHTGNRLLLAARTYHFPSATTFKMILSMVISATIRFTREFSFSSSLSLLRASVFNLPYSLFHLW